MPPARALFPYLAATGYPGIGKSRLAAELPARLRALACADPIRFADLYQVTQHCTTIALDFREGGDAMESQDRFIEPQYALGRRLAARALFGVATGQAPP